MEMPYFRKWFSHAKGLAATDKIMPQYPGNLLRGLRIGYGRIVKSNVFTDFGN